MRKGTGTFRQVEDTKLVCDQCGEDLGIIYAIRYDAHWSDGYDSYGDDADFCSLDCMTKFLANKEDSIYYPPDNEDVTLEIPMKFFKIVLAKLGD